jgi:hypothetical protein
MVSWKSCLARRSEKRLDEGNHFVGLTKFALPHRQDFPPERSEIGTFPRIATHSGLPLVTPESSVSGRSCAPPLAVVGVPEAPVDKDGLFSFRECDVRLARKTLHVKRVPVATVMKQSPQREFGPCIARLNCRHIARSLFAVKTIGHVSIVGELSIPFTALAPKWSCTNESRN